MSSPIGTLWEFQTDKIKTNKQQTNKTNKKKAEKKIGNKWLTFPKSGENINLHICEAQWPTYWKNLKRFTPGYIIKSQNIWHGKNLENKKRKVTHHIRGLLNKISDFKTAFSWEIMETKGSEMTFTMLNQIRLSTKNSISKHIYIY